MRSVLLPAAAMLLLGAAGFPLGSFHRYLLALVVVNCLVGAALVMVVGYGRVIMLATGAMMAVGAYGSAILMERLGLSYLATLPPAVAAGLVAGILLAVPSTRFRGHHLAMVTMMFQFLVVTGIREWTTLTGGSAGLRVPPIGVFGVPVVSDLASLLLVAVVAAMAVGLFGVFLAGRFGKTLRAITASEVACEAFGIDVPRFKVAAFAISSAALALAGALLGPRARILDPDTFGITQSIVALGYPIVGGASSIWGGLLGGALLRLLPEALRFLGQYQEIIVAALVVTVMILVPDGLTGLAARVGSMWRPRGAEGPVPSPAPAPSIRRQPAPAEPGTSGEPALEIAGLRKGYGALLAVSDVHLRIAPGTMHGLIGPNGAGKTTLFNAISGLVPADAGTVSMFGTRVDTLGARSRIAHGMTRTFQHVAVFDDLSCLDNVVLGLGRNGVRASLGASFGEVFETGRHRRDADDARVALSQVGIAHLAAVPAGSLSLGDQRRLEIARAIVSRPRLLLLDEPVSGVSESEETRIADLLRSLNETLGITMLVIEHNIAFVRRICSDISVMAAGRIIAQGDPDIVMAQPRVRLEYFGDVDAAAA